MAPTHTKVIYKPDSMSTDEFIVLVSDASALQKWRDGDKTVPLVEIVDSFDVFHTGQGAQGLLGRASKQHLDSVFGSAKDVDCVTQVLEKGRVETGAAPGKYSSGNDSRGGGFSVSKGSTQGGAGGR